MIWINGTLDGRDGTLEWDGSEIAFFKKSPLVRAFFGALGTSIATGKECSRFSISDVASYSLYEGAFKSTLQITLSDGTQFEFRAGSDLETYIIPALQASSASDGVWYEKVCLKTAEGQKNIHVRNGIA